MLHKQDRQLVSKRWMSVIIICMFISCFTLQISLAAELGVSEHLQSLPDSERDDLLAIMLTSRREMQQNIEVVSETRIYNTEFINGAPTKTQTADSGWFKYEFWFRGGSYRLRSNWFESQVIDEREWTSTASYLADEGVGRILSEVPGTGNAYARIAPMHDGPVRNNRAILLLNSTGHVPSSEFLLDSLLRARNEWTVQFLPDSSLIEFKIPYAIEGRNEGKPIGDRIVSLDSNRGMLPISSHLHWRDNLGWREEVSKFLDPKLYANLWLPTRFEEVVRSSTGEPNQCSHYDTVISNVRIGSVEREDLIVKFPPGTEVVDDYLGISYVEGEPNSKTPLGKIANLSDTGRQSPVSGGKSWLIWINIFAIVSIVTLAVYRKRKIAKR